MQLVLNDTFGDKIIDVLLPLSLPTRLSYRLPENLNRTPEIGKRVVVPLGKKKLFSGVIVKIRSEPNGEQYRNYRFIQEVVDDAPVVSPQLIQLYEWIAYYYMCAEGEVLRASMPAGLKLESEWQIEALAGLDINNSDLSDKAYLLLEALTIHKTLSVAEVSEITGLATPHAWLRKLEKANLIKIQGVLEKGYQPKTIRCLTLAPSYQSEVGMLNAFEQVKNSRKQEAILMLVVQAFRSKKIITEKEVLTKTNSTNSVTKTLVEKKILEIRNIPVERLTDFTYQLQTKKINFTIEQNRALTEIRQVFNTKPLQPVLLHGVTGSGKTHIYIELIRDALAQSKQAVYLLPEIGLTKQIIDKVKTEFGEVVGVYHSRFSDAERVEIWKKILEGEYRVVVGVRSAILLPFDRLGLIVVDEEHDSSFKQSERDPRYNARDVALYYSSVFQVPIVLGSATPSLESYQNALQNKYALVEIHTRAVEAQLPEIILVDMRQQIEAQLSYGLFSDVLVEGLNATLKRGEQAILFINRRGYSPFLICETCGNVPKCLHCDISLTYHKTDAHLRCHYCGYIDNNTEECMVCRTFKMRREGIGTERTEEHLNELLPQARIARMDLDTTKGKNAIQQLITKFERKEIDILIGTQMVTKGLDFENVTLAAVVQADRLLNYPDFRSYEYSYQILTQFSGRAGRSQKVGRVFIQTRNPENIVLQLLGKPYGEFYEIESKSRELPIYPPHCRLIKIELSHQDRQFIETEGKRFGASLFKVFQGAMLGPEYPWIARIRNYYRLHILIKIKKTINGKAIRECLHELIRQYYHTAPNKTLKINIDVDPR